MTSERLVEIRRDLCTEAYTSYLPKTVRELLDYIDGLKFANGVLDSVAKDAQAWSVRAQTAEAKCAQLEAQRGWAVVVPEPTVKQWIKEVLDAAYNDPEPHATMRAATKWFRENSKAIPADQVLADRMVGVDREELMYLHAFEKYARKHGPESIQDVAGTLDHLRSAQQAKGE